MLYLNRAFFSFVSGEGRERRKLTKMTSPTKVRRYDILASKRGVNRCQKEYQISVARQDSRRWLSAMMKEKLSHGETARRYDVSGRHRIQDWERIYLTEGAEGFVVERRGRGSTVRPRKLYKEVGGRFTCRGAAGESRE